MNIERTSDRTVCGRASVGSNPGTITFYNDVCSCGSNKVPAELVLHEVGHAMGFFHVPDRGSVMFPTSSGSCGASQLSAAERFHAAIAYSRPRGNRDPDIDPSSSRFPHRTADPGRALRPRSMAIAIRAAGLADAGDIARLTAQLGYDVPAADVARRLRRLLARPDQAVLVAEADGRVADEGGRG